MTDFSTMTDDDVRALRDECLLELENRAVIASADQHVSDINQRVLEAKGEAPGSEWTQPTGAGDAYPKDWEVQHKGKLWVSLTPANVWEPGSANWREVVTDTPTPTGPPEWVQPTGSTDAYPVGSQVTHNGSVWQTTVDANVWEPGVYGWDQVLASGPDITPAR